MIDLTTCPSADVIRTAWGELTPLRGDLGVGAPTVSFIQPPRRVHDAGTSLAGEGCRLARQARVNEVEVLQYLHGHLLLEVTPSTTIAGSSAAVWSPLSSAPWHRGSLAVVDNTRRSIPSRLRTAGNDGDRAQTGR